MPLTVSARPVTCTDPDRPRLTSRTGSSAGRETALLRGLLGGRGGARKSHRRAADHGALMPHVRARTVAGRRDGQDAGLGAGPTAGVELEVSEPVVDDGPAAAGRGLDDVGVTAHDDVRARVGEPVRQVLLAGGGAVHGLLAPVQ